MSTCEICHKERRVTIHTTLNIFMCEDCVANYDYWESLTPKERQAEEAAIAAYVEETRNWP